jgi:hypothetical protein
MKEILAGGARIDEAFEAAKIDGVVPARATIHGFAKKVEAGGGFRHEKMPRFTTWSPWPPGEAEATSYAIPSNRLPRRLKTHVRKQRKGKLIARVLKKK